MTPASFVLPCECVVHVLLPKWLKSCGGAHIVNENLFRESRWLEGFLVSCVSIPVQSALLLESVSPPLQPATAFLFSNTEHLIQKCSWHFKQVYFVTAKHEEHVPSIPAILFEIRPFTHAK